MSRPPFGSVLTHPLAIGALVILLVNDHVLKAAYPGWITGKLSDFSGMVIAPLVLVVIVDAIAPAKLRAGSGWACALAVGCAFAACKTWAPAAEAYEAGLALARSPFRWLLSAILERPPSSERVVLVRDATDLIALPMGAVAAWIARSRDSAHVDDRQLTARAASFEHVADPRPEQRLPAG